MLSKFSLDKNFNHLLKGSSFNAAAKVLAVAVGFVASFLIARTYGPDFIGNVATISSSFTLLSLFALLGNQTLIIKVLPEYIAKYNFFKARLVYRQILVITLIFTACVITAWTFLEKITAMTLIRGLEQYTFLISALLVLAVFKRLNTQALRGLGDYKVYSLFELLPAILLTLTAITAILLKIPEQLFQYIYFLPLLTMSFLSFIFVSRTFALKIKSDNNSTTNTFLLPTKSSLIRLSLPMFGVTLSNAIIAHFDILMLNYYTSSSTVGVYAIYVKIVTITALAKHSIDAMFAPTVSKLHSSNKPQELKTFAKKATLLSFITTSALAFAVFLFNEPLLGLYGPEFLEDTPTLHLLLTATLLGSFFGSVGFYLNMTGHQVSFFRIMVVAAIINVSLNMILIPQFGSSGAAAATLISVITWNLLATRKILKEYNYTLIWSNSRFL